MEPNVVYCCALSGILLLAVIKLGALFPLLHKLLQHDYQVHRDAVHWLGPPLVAENEAIAPEPPPEGKYSTTAHREKPCPSPLSAWCWSSLRPWAPWTLLCQPIQPRLSSHTLSSSLTLRLHGEHHSTLILIFASTTSFGFMEWPIWIVLPTAHITHITHITPGLYSFCFFAFWLADILCSSLNPWLLNYVFCLPTLFTIKAVVQRYLHMYADQPCEPDTYWIIL